MPGPPPEVPLARPGGGRPLAVLRGPVLFSLSHPLADTTLRRALRVAAPHPLADTALRRALRVAALCSSLFSRSSRLHQSPKAPTERHVLHACMPVSPSPSPLHRASSVVSASSSRYPSLPRLYQAPRVVSGPPSVAPAAQPPPRARRARCRLAVRAGPGGRRCRANALGALQVAGRGRQGGHRRQWKRACRRPLGGPRPGQAAGRTA